MRRALLATVVLILAACNRMHDPVTIGPSVSGRVFDAATRAPIAGARVEIGPRQAVSAANGAYYVGEAGRGMQPLTASKEGYATYTTGIQIEEPIVPRDIYLERQ